MSYVPDRSGGVEAWEREASSADEDLRRRLISGRFQTRAEYEASGWNQAEELLTALVGNPTDMSIMDFGCGDGRVTAPLSTLFRHVYAVDVAPSMLRAVNALELPGVTTVLYAESGLHVDASLVPWPTRFELKVDAAFSAWVLMHQTYEAAERIMSDVAAALPVGGRFYLQLPVYEVEQEAGWWAGVTTWTPQRFCAAAARAGFIHEKVRENAGSYAAGAGRNHHRLHVLRKT